MRILWRFIAGTVRRTWRLLNFVREFFLNLFFILLILIGIGLYFQFQNKPADPAKGALLVDLSGVVVDKPIVNDKLREWGRELLGSSSTRLQENSLFEVVENIRQAKADDNITGIVLSLNNFVGADQPSLQYMGNALREFRDSGKPIYAIGDSYNQIQYYLASFANKIYLSPQGSVELQGFSSNTLYYKSLLDKLKITTHVFRVGSYKSAVEPMIRDDMSPEAREANSRWIEGLWQNYLTEVASNRNLSKEQLFPNAATDIVSRLQAVGGNLAQYALDHKLVDRLASRSAIEAELTDIFGWDKQNNDFNFISIYNYQTKEKPQQDSQIAVILINGAIVDGLQTPGSVGGDTAAAQIRQARLDPKIEAVILRVNSPGGSVNASEVIRSELVALRAAGKPLVVSMGGMAASGGYWISTPANYIIANPSTLTGSIGIFGVINTVDKSLESIGVHTDGVTTSPLADVATTKALPSEFSQMMQINIEHGYQTFINLVATARHKTPEQVDQIAQGRVWMGSDAKNNDLVDQLGNFDDAVKKAAELAKLDNYELQWFVDQPSLSDMILSQIGVSVQAMLPAPLSAVATVVKDQTDSFNQFNDPQNRYVLCLTCGDIR
ncbi:signal peptide peptidase SppA [Candidatus Fukatsuia symbiotica]|uniref:Signal peptide peptidase SppA n=1 Tax=Candidatus Fukatsuia symbiotica TaxID=1878942 RepID=A0A2U8I2L8_9GAMM|nr:signal peptide peptidase SppA [Candidatus Fukatsuia symbiotica]AWK13357.1 signal peptide peptidase SppA [Candidatus Fukatsuia symbiotica]MEA9444244.1 signal peptide peptidase SppA [Candidatus Fukatsuia symbiotica]